MSTKPQVTARLNAETIPADYFTSDPHNARGYWYNDRAWAVVQVGGFEISACSDREEGYAGMLALADALTTAVARARQAEQDATLTPLTEAVA